MTVKLREYQEQCLTDLARHRREHPNETRLAVVMPTGTGKTITFAVEAARYLESFEGAGNRVLILTHTDELASQAEAKVRLFAPGYTVGVLKAERDETDADIVIGSVQTLANPERRARLTDVGHIIVDECELALAPSWRGILEHYGAMRVWGQCGDPECYGGCNEEYPTTVTGYTATLERGDGNSLGSLWQNVAFSRSISWAVRKGFLVPPRAYRVEVPDLDLRRAGYVSGEGDLSLAVTDSALVDSIAPERTVEAWMEHAKGRSTALFAPLVRSARMFALAFNNVGVKADVIYGDMPTWQRKEALAAYESGEITVLCNAMVLTRGWDAPRTECVIVARPTQSRPLFIQMAGRGLRPWLESPLTREEQDCVLLVVADATTELTSIADLSDRPIKAIDGKSLLALEDEYDLSTDLEPDPEHLYDGKVHVTEFDPLVQKSSKVWNRTIGGTWFLPAGDKMYVFLVQESRGWMIVATPGEVKPGGVVQDRIPDLELAMALAEDAASDLGGNLAALYSDKGRAWRGKPPSEDQIYLAARVGVGHVQVAALLNDKRSGKAGRLSDLIDRHRASRQIDPVVARIKGGS